MEQVRDFVFLQDREDGFNDFRKAYHDIMEKKIHEGRQGIEQERYLTITIERKNFEEAKAQFATIEACQCISTAILWQAVPYVCGAEMSFSA